MDKFLEILNEDSNQSLEIFNQGSKIQTVKIKIKSGEEEGKIITTNNMLSGNPAYDIVLKKGDKVILNIEEIDGTTEYNVANLYRFPMLMILLSYIRNTSTNIWRTNRS